MNQDNTMISGIELATYLQMIAAEKQTCMLKIVARDKRGVLCMKDGTLLNAKTQQLKKNSQENETSVQTDKEEAVMEMLRWEQPRISSSPLNQNVKRVITRSLEFLILESCRNDDEGLQHTEVPTADESEHCHPPDVASVLEHHTDINAYLAMDIQGNILLKDQKNDRINPDLLSFVHFTLTFNNHSSVCIDPQYMLFNLDDNTSQFIYYQKDRVLGLNIKPHTEIEPLCKEIRPLFADL